eukprot:m.81366 g.81366  ORF g.81366 m.81366 type:complete len:419 (-) comp14691_c0_seq3:1554-2810(-)
MFAWSVLRWSIVWGSILPWFLRKKKSTNPLPARQLNMTPEYLLRLLPPCRTLAGLKWCPIHCVWPLSAALSCKRGPARGVGHLEFLASSVHVLPSRPHRLVQPVGTGRNHGFAKSTQLLQHQAIVVDFPPDPRKALGCLPGTALATDKTGFAFDLAASPLATQECTRMKLFALHGLCTGHLAQRRQPLALVWCIFGGHVQHAVGLDNLKHKRHSKRGFVHLFHCKHYFRAHTINRILPLVFVVRETIFVENKVTPLKVFQPTDAHPHETHFTPLASLGEVPFFEHKWWALVLWCQLPCSLRCQRTHRLQKLDNLVAVLCDDLVVYWLHVRLLCHAITVGVAQVLHSFRQQRQTSRNFGWRLFVCQAKQLWAHDSRREKPKKNKCRDDHVLDALDVWKLLGCRSLDAVKKPSKIGGAVC